MPLDIDPEQIISEIQASADAIKPSIEPVPMAVTEDLAPLAGIVGIALQNRLVPISETDNRRTNRLFVYSAVCGIEVLEGSQMYWHIAHAMKLRWQKDDNIWRPNERCEMETPILRDHWYTKVKGQQILPIQETDQPTTES